MIPDYQSLMLPLLMALRDGQEHQHREVFESLASQLRLADAERDELLPSGQRKFYNRVGWARTYLKKADLIEYTRRGNYRITGRGLEVLDANPSSIDAKFLGRFPEFRQFQRTGKQEKLLPVQETMEEARLTPEETLEASYQSLRSTLAQELLDRVKISSPQFFERLVIDLLVAMGYGGSRTDAGQAIGRSGDEGIDGIIKEDKLGLDAVYIQAKRWEGRVSRPDVQRFSGSLDGQRARKGVLITTSQFSQEARDFVTRIDKKIVLIDGEQLTQFMIDYGIGVAEVASYVVKKVDSDYFGEE